MQWKESYKTLWIKKNNACVLNENDHKQQIIDNDLLSCLKIILENQMKVLQRMSSSLK